MLEIVNLTVFIIKFLIGIVLAFYLLNLALLTLRHIFVLFTALVLTLKYKKQEKMKFIELFKIELFKDVYKKNHKLRG